MAFLTIRHLDPALESTLQSNLFGSACAMFAGLRCTTGGDETWKLAEGEHMDMGVFHVL